MNDIFLISSNFSISIIGFVLCSYILLSGKLNQRTARCVITTCLGGFIWFSFLYLAFLHLYTPGYYELFSKLTILIITCSWVDKTIKGCN